MDNIIHSGWPQMTDIMDHSHCILDTCVYKHTFRTYNSYCFSTATVIARTLLSVISSLLVLFIYYGVPFMPYCLYDTVWWIEISKQRRTHRVLIYITKLQYFDSERFIVSYWIRTLCVSLQIPSQICTILNVQPSCWVTWRQTYPPNE